ncbi:hypothetical protein BDW75DRAFT_242605 [Aspergillus navahoensis]
MGPRNDGHPGLRANLRVSHQTGQLPPVPVVGGETCIGLYCLWAVIHHKTIAERVDALARSLGRELAWSPNTGSPWDKVIGIFSFNTLDFLIASWAVHRVGGICLLVHPTSSAAETKRHIELTKCRVLFTCRSLLSTANEVLSDSEIHDPRLYLLDLPEELGKTPPLPDQGQKTVAQLIREEEALPPLEALEWADGQGRDQWRIYKLAMMITHYNIIANIMQSTTFEAGPKKGRTEVALGFLPLSHSYGLILAHLTAWRGATYVLHARFDMQAALASIEKYRIERLYLVPPIISALVNNPFLELCDTSSVTSVVTGSGPFGPRLAAALSRVRPSWQVLPGYGLTETAVIISTTHPNDTYLGADGCLVPGVEARLINSDGNEVEAYNEPGELLLKWPSIMKGYLGQEAATQEVFDEQGWLRTGDIAVFRLNNNDGKETAHLDIVDRKKDIMKVKGLQVALAAQEYSLCGGVPQKQQWEAAQEQVEGELGGLVFKSCSCAVLLQIYVSYMRVRHDKNG